MFLALARSRRASRGRICEQLRISGSGAMANGYFRQTCTRARGFLGAAADGSPRVLRDRETYYLNPDVGLDWATFQELAGKGQARGRDGVEKLRAALDLVRGEPLQDCPYEWIDQAMVTYMRSRIVEVAECLSARAEDPVVAGWAACRGLLADPYAEQLYRALMRSAHVAGHTRALFGAYELCMEALSGLGLKPDEQTTGLLYDLTGSRSVPRSFRRCIGGRGSGA
ncbi:bacterial transcriptional activator domain-containing protein [Actinomadura barringtoniae]|uniref:Bacterial transcriptional activator domain-containing protein n=1 Tax=Actinomadura barringtoniae TaxID=1427535 RepID=A0A939PHK4_9ACTN|nr:bacterial transcriptional activator domain-containing protein [Actinomadura barringtoniae]MBO2448681.1 bacterial transcriptional activator domain-containing protein [Actinomadura barringtoniae]